MQLRAVSLAVVALVAVFASGCKTDKPVMSLHQAAATGTLDQLEYHFKAKADLNARDPNGDTPLVLAARGGHVKAVGRLIEHGADVNTKAADGTTPMAAAAGHPQVAALLRENGAKEDPMALVEDVLKSFDVIFALLAEYPDDCDKAMAELEAYMEKEGPRLQALFARLQAMEPGFTTEQRQAFGERMQQRGQALAQKASTVMMQFAQRCPDHMARFAKVLQQLTPKPLPAERAPGVAQ